MLECLILGDSIAVGISQHMQECHVEAKVGISASEFGKKFKYDVETKTVIISLGSNPQPKHLRLSLEQIRSKVHAQNVIWVIPKKDDTPKEIAELHGDKYVTIDGTVDGIHPTSYQYLTRKIRKIMK